jgi:regulator of replication initiation timing
LTGKELNPDFIMESGDNVYLHDYSQGILQFDLFGTYIQTLPIKNSSNFQVEQNTILYLENGYLLAYSLKDFSLAKMELPHPDVKQFRKVDNKLILSYEEGIEIYRLQKK